MLDDRPRLTDTARDLLGTAQDFLRRQAPACDASVDAAAAARKLWPALRDMGWFRLLVPEPHGMGLALRDVAPLFAAAGRVALPGPLAEHVVVLPAVVATLGERAGGVAALLDGDELAAFADPAVDAVRSRRSPTPTLVDGQLTGTVDLVRWGAEAATLLIAARGHGGDALVALPAGVPGVRVDAMDSMDPRTPYAAVTLDVAARSADVLAEGRVATELLGTIRAQLRLVTAWELSGLATALGTMALEYAKVREQFGRPIGSFQAVKHTLADMAVRLGALRNLCESASADSADDGTTFGLSAAAAKAYAAEVARTVALDALQVHGGVGFTIEHDLHVYLKRIHSLQGAYGDERELSEVIGRHLVARGLGGGTDLDVDGFDAP